MRVKSHKHCNNQSLMHNKLSTFCSANSKSFNYIFTIFNLDPKQVINSIHKSRATCKPINFIKIIIIRKTKIKIVWITKICSMLIKRTTKIWIHMKNRNFIMINLFKNSNKWNKLTMKIISKLKNSKKWDSITHCKSMREKETMIFHQDLKMSATVSKLVF